MTTYKDPADWTAEEIMTVIPKVLNDPKAVHACIRLLAIRDPDLAQHVLDTIEVGLWLAERRDQP